MIITAEQKNTRQTPTRLRLVAKAVKKMSLEDAMSQLRFMNKKAATVMEKVFKQAVANATKNLGLSLASLTIKDIVVGEGARYKRFQAVSRGRAHSILKRTSHVRVVLESNEEEKAKKAVVKKQTAEDAKGAKSTSKESKLSKESKPMSEQKQMTKFQLPKKEMVKAQTTVKTVSIRKTGER